MSKTIRLTALVLSMLVLVLCFTSAVSVFHEHSENCTGDDCPICAAISLNKDIYGILLAFLACSITFELYFPFRGFNIEKIKVFWTTPVLLKVKMTN